MNKILRKVGHAIGVVVAAVILFFAWKKFYKAPTITNPDQKIKSEIDKGFTTYDEYVEREVQRLANANRDEIIKAFEDAFGGRK